MGSFGGTFLFGRYPGWKIGTLDVQYDVRYSAFLYTLTVYFECLVCLPEETQKRMIERGKTKRKGPRCLSDELETLVKNFIEQRKILNLS